MPDLKLFAIILFVAMYVLLVALPKFRPVVALAAAAIYVVSGVLPVDKVLTSIDWNVLMMLFGTMVIVDYFIESKMPNLIAEWLLRLAPNVLWVTVLMSLFSGIISAFPAITEVLPVIGAVKSYCLIERRIERVHHTDNHP